MTDVVRIDTSNKNTLWQDTVALEMKKFRIAFQLYNGDPTSLHGYKPVGTHLIFDIKLGENFRQKSDVSGTVTGLPHLHLLLTAQ